MACFILSSANTLQCNLIGGNSEALAMSLSSAIVFSMIMDYSRDKSRAIDYSVQSSLFALTRIISAVIAGIMVSTIGFGGMFLFEIAGMISVIFVIYKFYKE